MSKARSLFSRFAVIATLALLPSVALAETYDVTVKTGKVKWGGTDSNVWITLYGVLPASHNTVDSGVIQLVNKGVNDFAAGSTRQFRITTPADITLKSIYSMRVEEDASGKEPDWYLESIELKDVDSGKTKTFLCNGWLSKKIGLSRNLKPFEHF
jgi:hypothetical protein